MRVLNQDASTALEALFRPSRIALVGASDRPNSTGAVLWDNLSGFAGEVVPISASGRPMAGARVYRSLLDVPGTIDLVVIAVPAASVPTVVREAGAKGARACVVITSGFAETGVEGARLQRRLEQAAHDAGVRLIGPNCYGVQNTANGLNASIASSGSARTGTISLVTQSGAYGMALHTLAADEQLSFDKVVATGNKVDVGDAELLDHLGRHGSGPICFFLESLPDGRAFFDVALGVTPHRPVIVCRTGASESGRRAARSHTASLAGTSRTWSAAFARAGIIETRSGLEMLDVARALEHQAPPAGNRVGIVTNSGGVGVELTDLLVEEGLQVPLLSEEHQHQLADLLPPHGSAQNPVDVTTAWQQFPRLYGRAIDQLARSGEVDCIVAVLLQRSASTAVAEAVADTATRLRGEGIQVPVFVCWVAARDSHRNADPLRRHGIPVFEWPARTARAVGHASRYGMRGNAPTHPSADAVDEPASDTAAGWLEVVDAAGLLARHGIPLARWDVCSTAPDAVLRTSTYRRPVVLKAVHPDLLHKAGEGGVALDLSSDGQVSEAAHRLLRLREGASLLVQEQELGAEVIVGAVRDVEFGPVVMVGMGGVDVETTDDVQLALAPVTVAEAKTMFTRLRGSAALLDPRTAGVDLDAIAAVVTALGDLMAAHEEITEVDLNPVLARREGCVVVDWRIRAASSSCQDSSRTAPGEP